MKKRGISHIEAVLSFVIFVGFLIFAFFFFSPFSGENRLLVSSLDYAFREINDNITVNVESYSVVIDYDTTEPIIGVVINSSIANAQARVEDSQGAQVSSFLSGDNVYFNRPSDGFVSVKFSEDFPNGQGSSGFLVPSKNYSVSSSDKEKIYSENKALELNDSYYLNYIELKRDFNLPNRVDFGFSVRFDDGSKITAEKTIPENLEVFSKEERIKIIRQNGEIEFADLTIKIW